MKQFTFTLLLLSFAQLVFAFTDTTDIPLSRRSRHDDIKKEQINCDKIDGVVDGVLKAGTDVNINNQLSDALIRKPNEFRFWIEQNDSLLPSNNDKVRYLRYVAEVLIKYRLALKENDITIIDLTFLLNQFELAMKAKANKQSIIPILQELPYGIAKILAKVLAENDDAVALDNLVYLKYVTLHPDKILSTIALYETESFADSLMTIACKAYPVQCYTYAQSKSTVMGKLIHRNTNMVVNQIALLSQTENALLYFPFFDDLLSGRQTIDSIKKFVGDGEVGYDSVGYYKLLVSTAIAYNKRMAAPLRDTPIAYFGTNGLLNTLYKKAKQHFITPINELHDESNLAYRMKAIQPLSPAELYYMIVMGENDIYTSSYKNSFNRLVQLMGAKPRGDSLLQAVNFDHFRKFIKMAANYNKLDTFLKMMPPVRSELLMKAFVSKLDNGNLEDAVDVADSYSSITNSALQQSMLQNVKENEAEAIAANNTSGKVIYGLLKTIFLSLNDSNHIDIAAQLGIPPIFDVDNKYMQNANGVIVEQVFFYGDKDGKMFYPSFRNTFSSKEWKVVDKKEWMEATSLKGNVMVFANKPLDNDANLDDTAQIHLANYLKEIKLKPAVIVHRGHSYWLDRTMSRMPGDAKIVVLGSCGGYQNLNEILEINPDAHIISTKEIGTGDINRPILNYMNQVFASGNNLNWRKMWQSLTKTFSADPSKSVRDSWEDYIPPYKNLGAIFLKAYTKKMETE
ncbi:hypothetical protein ACFOWM_10250 [Ferruginibacter yonginensis]|uniref:Uncharacterized protein n=1 Tax=Ferruginibacter yonginensis TaxID=1310416 RepID=A0ABV8QUE1_9BACT